jgi:rhomboid family GlyGly-CTERM serine protease
MSKYPWLTSLIIATAAIIYACPGGNELLIYDKRRILDGECWRMLSGHLVHGSLEHLIRDASSLLFFGSILEHRLRRAYVPFLISAALAISTHYLFYKSLDIHYYGLSGINYALTGLLLSQELPKRWSGRPQWSRAQAFLFAFYAVMAVLIGCKVGYESLSPSGAIFYRAQMKPAPEAHVLGTVWGWFYWQAKKVFGEQPLVLRVPWSSISVALAGGAIYLGMVFFW